MTRELAKVLVHNSAYVLYDDRFVRLLLRNETQRTEKQRKQEEEAWAAMAGPVYTRKASAEEVERLIGRRTSNV